MFTPLIVSVLPLIPALRLNIILIILIIASILVGGVLPLIERKFLSLMQRRVGPSVVGYRGRLQFVADALKLFLKEVIVIKHVNVSIFSGLPCLFFVLNTLLLLALPWGYATSGMVSVEYSLPMLLAFFSMCNLIVIFTGLNLKNKYTTVSSRRASMMAVNFDIVITALLLIIATAFNHFGFSQLSLFSRDYATIVFVPPILLLVVIMFLMDVGRAPFDLVESESELIMGFHSEYSSFLFALYILGEYIHIYVFSFLTALLIYGA